MSYNELLDEPMAAPVTKDEKEQILMTAIGLIREPENWTQSKWKCPALDMKTYHQKVDDNGEPLFLYCVHGALNQATYDVLGAERASELGAVDFSEPEDYQFNGCHTQYGRVAEWIGVDLVAKEEYGLPAMDFNDAGPAETEAGRKTHHQKVIGLLRTRLSQLTGRAV